MTDNVINIFNKQLISSEVDQQEIEDTISSLAELKDSLKEVIFIAVTKDDEMIIRSSNMTRETAYYLLGLAQMNALTQ
jgi:hypothetical protein